MMLMRCSRQEQDPWKKFFRRKNYKNIFLWWKSKLQKSEKWIQDWQLPWKVISFQNRPDWLFNRLQQHILDNPHHLGMFTQKEEAILIRNHQYLIQEILIVLEPGWEECTVVPEAMSATWNGGGDTGDGNAANGNTGNPPQQVLTSILANRNPHHSWRHQITEELKFAKPIKIKEPRRSKRQSGEDFDTWWVRMEVYIQDQLEKCPKDERTIDWIDFLIDKYTASWYI